MLDRLQKAWEKSQSVMVQMPTGTGKTVLLAEEIRREVAKSKESHTGGVLVVAHRIELIEQISRTLERAGIDHGLIVSGKAVDRTKCVQVASIQTLVRRSTDNTDYSLIIVDEAHHALAKTYKKLWEWWPEAKFLGLTATPCRMNNTGFTDLFNTILVSWSIQEFIDKGWLSDFDYISAKPDNLMMQLIAGLGKRGADGDYQVKEMATVMDVPESIAHLYNTYKQFVDGKKGIVYAIDREHARHITDYYQSHGVSCCWIEARTPAAERERLIEDYRADRIKVCVNVDILGEGVDFPEVEFIQLARPTLSLCKYLQQVGRGMRISKGKECVTILDQVGLYQTFGLPTDERDWTGMFTGRIAGKAGHVKERPIIIRDEPEEKRLVNLKMVRIKRRGEQHAGVEVFLQGGRYGFMCDGKITCPAEFESIKRISDGYYALATYPYYIHKNRVTVIDMQGRDLKVAFYGNVSQKGDLFYGQTVSDKMVWWDGKSRAYHDSRPVFEHVGNLDMRRVGNGLYQLRRPSPLLPHPVSKSDIFYNDKLTVINDIIILNDENATVLKPLRYYGYKVQIEARRNGRKAYRWVTLAKGLTDEYAAEVFFEGSRRPYWKDAKMMNAATGKMEYLSPQKGK